MRGSIENAKRAGSKISPQNLVSRFVSSEQSARSVWRLSPGIVLEDYLIPMHAESRRCLSSEKHLVSEHRKIPFRRVNRQLSRGAHQEVSVFRVD